MTLFAKFKPKPNPELELMLAIKYGPPAATKEYTDRLPLSVVKFACAELYEMDNLDRSPEEVLRDNLRVILQRPANLERMASILFSYHSLLGKL